MILIKKAKILTFLFMVFNNYTQNKNNPAQRKQRLPIGNYFTSLKIHSYLSILIFLFGHSFSFAQEQDSYDYWLQEYEAGFAHFEASEIEAAVSRLKNATDTIDLIDFSTNNETLYYPISNYNYLGVCYFQLKDFKAASEAFLNALKHMSKIETPDIPFRNQVIENLIRSYDGFDLNKALEIRLNNLKLLESENGKDSQVYTEFLFSVYSNYDKLGQTNKAFEALKELCLIYENLGNLENPYYAYSVYNLAHVYFKKEDYRNAEIYFKKSVEMHDVLMQNSFQFTSELIYYYGLSLYRQNKYQETEQYLSANINAPELKNINTLETYVYSVDVLATAIRYQERTEDAKTIYKESLNYLSSIVDKFNPLYLLQRTNYSRLLINTEDYDSAYKHSIETYNIYQESNDKSSKAYVNVLNNIGLIHMHNSDFKKAEEFMLQSLDISKSKTSQNPFDIAAIEGNLALVYQSIGDYKKAKIYHKKVLESKSKLMLPTSPEYAKALMNYANYLYETGLYFEAEDYHLKSLDILSKSVGKNNLEYATQLNNLGVFYLTTRQIKKSLNSLNEAIDIYKTNKKENTNLMALALNSKAKCLLLLGSKEEAFDANQKAYDIVVDYLGENSIHYGSIAKALGTNYYLKGDVNKALDLYKKAYENYEKFYPSGHAIYGDLLSGYLELYLSEQRYEEALDLIEKIELNRIENFGIESFNYGQILAKKAGIYLSLRNLDEALHYFNSAKNIYSKTLDTDSDLYNDLLFNYAITLDLSGNLSEATKYYKAYNKGIANQLEDVFTYRSENDKKKFLERFKISLDWLNGTIFNTTEISKELTTIGVDNQLLLKSLLLNASKDIFKDLRTLDDVNIKSKIDTYQSLKLQSAATNKLQNAASRNTIKSQLNAIETELVALHSQKFRTKNNIKLSKSWLDMKSNLQSNEIAIEFLNFESRDDDRLSGEMTYGAYLIHKDWEQPKVVELFKEKDLKAILKNQNPNSLYQTRGSKSTSASDTKGLYELIWSPIDQYVKDIETIYYSPSGLLNQIPFSALDTEDKPILAKLYNLVQLSSTYSLTHKSSIPNSDNALFIGGISYDEKLTTTENTSDKVSSLSNLKTVKGTRSFDSKWNYLPGTLEEISTISNLFTNNNKTHNKLTGKIATETAFKKLSGKSPSVIHIATHGFFFENPKTSAKTGLEIDSENIYKVAEDPLLRSGLLFAGANTSWTNSSNTNAIDDGILTALEISNLDLSNSDMVILSACETGLGDIEGSEGVYGLQRAFKMAGVDIIVMSLWEVPDEETSEFMQLFYSNWLNGKPVRAAFRKAQLTMAETYKHNPEKWAAFVLFE